MPHERQRTVSAATPVRRPAQLRGAAALHLPQTAPSRAARPTRSATLPRPRLVLVAPHRTTAGRLPFLILVGTVLVGGLVAVLLLHMVAAQDAFRVTGLQQRLAALTDSEQQEAQLVAADSSPISLQARAVALGMVPSEITKFHRRAGGRAIAVQSPVYVPPPAPPVSTKSSAKKASTKTATTKSASTGAATTKSTSSKGTATTTSATTSTTAATAGKSGSPASSQPPKKHKKHERGHSN